jgi:ABC-type multidrug transport system fused ATPase/permease subunit
VPATSTNGTASSNGASGVVTRGLRVLGHAIVMAPRPFAVAMAGAALYAGMTVASALVFGAVTDRVIIPAFATGATSRGALAAAAAVVLGVAALKAAGIVGRRVGATFMQLTVVATYRERVTARYNRLPLAWHRTRSTGALLSNANADVEAAFWPIAPFPLSCGALLMLIATLGVLISTDWFLTAVTLIVCPLVAFLYWRYNRAISGPATRVQQYRAYVSGVAHESFDGALVVKTLGQEEAETERFAAESERLRDELIRYGRTRALFDPLTEALPNAGVLLVFLVGTWRLSQGALTIGGLVQFGYLFTLMVFPIRAIGWVLSDMSRSVVGWERVQEVLTASGDLRYGVLDGPAPATPARADVIGVDFRYGACAGDSDGTGYADEPVLRDVTLRAPQGRTIALVGPTGAGKSTIASLLVRLADPDTGKVTLDGVDLRDMARGTLPRSVAIVFQSAFLFDDSVRGNVTLGEEFSDEQVRAACRLAQADGFISALPDGYDTVVGEQGLSLSGGQRQRIALARALIRRPRLLILDDATSSVDPVVEAAILRGLRAADLPSTIVVIAYRQATIALADEIVFVERGRVRAHGSHSRLMASVPAYARLITAYWDPDRSAS